MRVYNKILKSNQLLNANITTDSMQLLDMVGYSIQVSITGTPNGTFKLQGSADKFSAQDAADATTWVDISDSSVTVTTSGNFIINVTDVFYNYVRVVYTDASSGASTATATITFNGKGV